MTDEILDNTHSSFAVAVEPEFDSDGKWTHTDTDISGEDSAVQAVANAVWTDTVKANYKTWKESQEV